MGFCWKRTSTLKIWTFLRDFWKKGPWPEKCGPLFCDFPKQKLPRPEKWCHLHVISWKILDMNNVDLEMWFFKKSDHFQNLQFWAVWWPFLGENSHSRCPKYVYSHGQHFLRLKHVGDCFETIFTKPYLRNPKLWFSLRLVINVYLIASLAVYVIL